MKIKEKALEYFKLFEEGNDIGLSEIYDEKIVLIDWNGKWESKSEVIKMNQELFEGSKILISSKLKSSSIEDIKLIYIKILIFLKQMNFYKTNIKKMN